MTTYSTGTASVENGETTVSFTGASLGTATEPTLRGGDLFAVPGQPMVPPQRLISVDYGAETAELWAPWPGTTIAAAPYEVRFVDDGIRKTAQTRLYLQLLGQLAALGLQPNAFGPDLAARAAYDDEAAGFIFLEVGDPWTLYIKLSATSADWDDGQTMEGAPGEPGTRGWSPVYGIATDGARRVKELVGYVGGEGTAPTAGVGEYVGAAGYVTDIAAAVDVRGGVGAAGPPNSLEIGTVEDGAEAAALITGDAPNQTLHLTLPRGADSTVPGPVGVDWQGDYDDEAAYVANDGVLDNGSSWRALGPTTGNPPPTLPTTSNTWWKLIAAAGADGTGTGDVVGPASAVNNRVALFDGTTGKLLKDSGVAVADFATAAQGAKADTAVQPGALGDAAGKNTGTTAGTVAAGDDGRFGTVPDGYVEPAKMNDGAAVSILGRSANSSGVRADIAAGANDRLLARVGDALSFVQLTVGMIADSIITFGKLATSAYIASGEYASGAANKLLTAAGVWADNATFALTDAATIGIDLNAFVSAAGCALAGNRTLGNPTNATKANQHFTLWFTATTSARTLALGSNYKKATAVESFPISIATTETVGVHCIMRTSTLCVVTGVTRYTT